jgi:ABC-type multidrug transport system fused ATPase/permease subunit
LVGRDVLDQVITAGSLVVFYGYLQNLIGNSSDMINTYETTLSAKAGIGRMMSIFWTKISIAAGHQTLPRDWTKISIKDANFAYKNNTDSKARKIKNPQTRGAIKNLAISIPQYAKIGIVGQTGSGKSTFAKILAGLYPLSSGEYTIGGISFYQLTHEEQTKQITLVLQETEIFNLSLADNITLMKKITGDTIIKALEISQLQDLVSKLPQGLDTLVGEKGYQLSGGERQRVGIARAICKNSPIIILDEATSSLDSQTELLIQQALEKNLKNKTIISIAHRVSTLQKTDLIYVFDEGIIVEKGQFEKLSTDKHSKFYELYQGQKA